MPPRQLLRVVGLVGMLLLAGCSGGLGGLVGDESLTFTADEVTVADSAVSNTDFTEAADKEIAFEEEFEVEGQSVEVSMNAHMVHLQRSYQGAPLGHAVVLSLPQIEVLGQRIDVVERINPADLMSRAQGSAGEIEREQKIGERSVEILGEQRTIEVFRGTAEQDGTSAPVKIYVGSFPYEGNTIVAVGIIPVEGDNQEEVLEIFGATQAA